MNKEQQLEQAIEMILDGALEESVVLAFPEIKKEITEFYFALNQVKAIKLNPNKEKAEKTYSLIQEKIAQNLVTNIENNRLNIERENIKGRSSLIEKLNLYRETMKNGIKLAIGGGILVVAILALFVAYPESGEQMLSSIGIEMTGTPTQEIDKTIDQVLAAADVDFAIAETESDEEALALLDSAALSDLGGSYGEENL